MASKEKESRLRTSPSGVTFLPGPSYHSDKETSPEVDGVDLKFFISIFVIANVTFFLANVEKIREFFQRAGLQLP